MFLKVLYHSWDIWPIYLKDVILVEGVQLVIAICEIIFLLTGATYE